jgi:hypothetical protein
MGLSGISKSQVSKLCKEIDERVHAFLDIERLYGAAVLGFLAGSFGLLISYFTGYETEAWNKDKQMVRRLGYQPKKSMRLWVVERTEPAPSGVTHYPGNWCAPVA